MALYNPLLVKRLEQILKKEPDSKSFCALAHIYRSQGELEKAEKLCLEGLIYHPSYSQAYLLLGEIYRDQKQIEKAIKFLNKAKELNPDNPNIYKNLGEIYKKQGDMEKTLNAYKMVLLLKPEDKTAILTVKHLEKIFVRDITVPEQTENSKKEKKLSSSKTVSEQENQKLTKLNKILARIENYITDEKSKKD